MSLLVQLVLQARYLVSELAVLQMLSVKLTLKNALSVTLQCFLLVDALRLKLLLSQLTLQVCNAFPGIVDLVVFLLDLSTELLYLLVQASLVRYFTILEVFDYIQFVLFQHVVIGV